MTHGKKILFVGNNPGGVRALLPVIERIPLSMVALTPPVRNLAPASLPIVEIPLTMSSSEIKDFLAEFTPSLLVTGTSITSSPGGNLENLFRQHAKSQVIPSLSLVDHWCNYTQRFTSAAGPSLDSLPDRICIMDDRAREEMIAEGFPSHLLSVTGQPAFDEIFQKILPAMPQLKREGRKALGISDDRTLIGFISEPVQSDHGNLRGYHEDEAFGDCLELCGQLAGPVTVFLKLHPRESEGKYDAIRSKFRDVPCVESISFDPNQLIAVCDSVVGMTSVLLLKAVLLGLPAASYQPRSSQETDWARIIKPLPVLGSKDELEAFLQNSRKQSGQGSGLEKFYQERHATERVLSVIRELTPL